MVVIALVIIAIRTDGLFAQPPDTAWTKTFGGSDDDLGYSVQQTLDGGYIITGRTDSYGAGQTDFYLIKTDASGNQQWYKTFGGSSWDESYSVQPTLDSGYIITGWTQSYGAGGDVYLIKTDANGDSTWTKTFGGSSNDGSFSVQPTLDSGYIITGWTQSYGAGDEDVYLIKTDASGNQQWYKTFGGSDEDESYSVQPTLDSGYIITGWTQSYGAGEQVYLIKTDANGDSTWTKTFGGSSGDIGNSVQQTLDGGYIITGITWSYGAGRSDVYLIKTDANGDTSWTKTFGGSDYDGGSSVQQTLDGGYIITGNTWSYGAGVQVYLIKTDANGDSTWTKTFGGSFVDIGRSVQQTTDGGYIISGFTNSYGAGFDDVYLIKVEPEVGIEEKETPLSHSLHFVASFNKLEIKYFLPHADWVRIKVYNSYGRAIHTLLDKKQGAGDHILTWDGIIPQGIYFIHLETSQTKQIGKAIIFR